MTQTITLDRSKKTPMSAPEFLSFMATAETLSSAVRQHDDIGYPMVVATSLEGWLRVQEYAKKRNMDLEDAVTELLQNAIFDLPEAKFN